MYESFFELQRAPFLNIPDPDFLYPAPQHRQATSILRYALMSRTGFCVLTGEIGAGKTTLIRYVLRSLDTPLHVGLVSNTNCETFDEFLRWILLAFELEYRNKDKVEMYDDFVQFLIRQYRNGSPVTLVIDEAQNLSKENLEQLRMLSNVNTERGLLLQTILIGQPELWATLNHPSLVQFAQRISCDYFLRPLVGAEQVGGYIQHRLRSAGGREDIIAPEAFPLIAEAAHGIPRLINQLCDTALVYAYGEDVRTVSAALVARVIDDKAGSFSALGRRPRADGDDAQNGRLHSARINGSNGGSDPESGELVPGRS